MPFSKWIDKWAVIHQTVQYYSCKQTNKNLLNHKTQGILRYIILSEKNPSEKTTCYMIPTVWHSGKIKTMETVKRLVIVSGWSLRRDEYLGHRRFLGRWRCSLGYQNEGYMSLYIFPNSECTKSGMNCKVIFRFFNKLLQIRRLCKWRKTHLTLCSNT